MREPRSLRTRFDRRAVAEFDAQPLRPAEILQEADLAHLPDVVQRFVRRSGAVGRPRVRNVRVEFDALMWRSPDASPMTAPSVQYNFFDRPARIFLMSARMLGLPVRALHVYAKESATFTVRVASLVDTVSHEGPVISRAETVTVLNDMCVLAPASLIDRRLAWTPIDEYGVRVDFTNGPHAVSAILQFNERDELVDFSSEDRPAAQNDGSLRNATWRTPIGEYHDIDGRWLPRSGDAVYDYPEGAFRYGRFVLRSIAYDVAGPS